MTSYEQFQKGECVCLACRSKGIVTINTLRRSSKGISERTIRWNRGGGMTRWPWDTPPALCDQCSMGLRKVRAARGRPGARRAARRR